MGQENNAGNTMRNNYDTVEIPKEFYSFSTGAKFEYCIECDCELLQNNQEYFVEKAIKKYKGFDAFDVIFEYAICINCAEKMRKSLSRESLQHIEQYFHQRVDYLKRMDLMHNHPHNPIAWISECLVSGRQQSDLSEYQIYGHCRGNQLYLSQMPYMVSGAVLEEVSSILSKETKDELDDFSRRHFGPPPELEEPLPYQRVMLI